MPERFKLDENLPRAARKLLLDAGHDAHSVADEGMCGSQDDALLAMCQVESRILVTLDLDFADVRKFSPSGHPGVWVVRPDLQSIASVLSALSGALELLGTQPTANRLWIVEGRRVRIRGQ